MSRWLLNKDLPITEPEIKLLSDEEVLCAPGGQVMNLDGERSTYDLNRDLEKKLSGRRKELWANQDRTKLLDEVRNIAGMHRLSTQYRRHAQARGTARTQSHKLRNR